MHGVRASGVRSRRPRGSPVSLLRVRLRRIHAGRRRVEAREALSPFGVLWLEGVMVPRCRRRSASRRTVRWVHRVPQPSTPNHRDDRVRRQAMAHSEKTSSPRARPFQPRSSPHERGPIPRREGRCRARMLRRSAPLTRTGPDIGARGGHRQRGPRCRGRADPQASTHTGCERLTIGITTFSRCVTDTSSRSMRVATERKG